MRGQKPGWDNKRKLKCHYKSKALQGEGSNLSSHWQLLSEQIHSIRMSCLDEVQRLQRLGKKEQFSVEVGKKKKLKHKIIQTCRLWKDWQPQRGQWANLLQTILNKQDQLLTDNACKIVYTTLAPINTSSEAWVYRKSEVGSFILSFWWSSSLHLGFQLDEWTKA